MQAIVTIVSSNYLHFARTLLRSLREHHPDSSLFCVLVDRDVGPVSALSGECELIRLEQLNLPDGDQFIFQYSILELSTAVKPWAIGYLLGRSFSTVTYIDPDILVFAPLQEAEDLMSAGADIVITPHLLSPVTDNLEPGELNIKRAGTYNLGFCAVRASGNTYCFLKWWQAKLMRDCVMDVGRGIFVDQSWIDLVPGLFQNVAILRHQGYNVAYWNIAQRQMTRNPDGRWEVNGEPLVFFHFSGLDPFNPVSFSRHQNRFTLATLGDAAEIVTDYAVRVIGNGAAEYSVMQYSFGRFQDGTPIPDAFRRTYRESDVLRSNMGTRPFEHPQAMLQSVGPRGEGELPLTWLMLSLHNARPDLQQAFQLNNVDSVATFYRWFIEEGGAGFPQFIVDHHKEIFDQWSAPVPAMPLGQEQEADRVDMLFLALLDRLPDTTARQHYADRCESWCGYVGSLLGVGFSFESRRRPRLIARMIKALFAPVKAQESH